METEMREEEGTPVLALADGERAIVDRMLAQGETLLAAIGTDILHTGMFGRGCFVATDRRLLAIDLGCPDAEVAIEVALADIVSLDRRDHHGFCRLEARGAERTTTVAYCTRTVMALFEEAIGRVEALLPAQRELEGELGDGTPGEPHHHGRGGHHGGAPTLCPTCGKPISAWVGVCPTCIDKRKILSRLLAKARPYLAPMSGGLVLMLAITAIEMAQPVLTKVLIDTVIPNRDLRLFLFVIVGIIGIHVFSSLFSGTRSYLMAWLGEKIVHDMRTDLYGHLQRLSISYYDQHETGWIMDRVSADTSNLQDFLAEGFQDFIRDFMSVIVIIAIMLAMDRQLALITLIPAPAIVFLTLRFMRKIRKLYHGAWRRRARMTALLTNVIPGVRVVKAFAQERRENDTFVDRSADYMQANIRASRAFSTFHPVTNFVTSLGFVMVWSYGGYQVITGKGVTLGTLIAFISYLWRFYGPLNNLSRFSRRVQRAFTSAQRVFDVLDATPTLNDPPTKREMPPICGEVSLKGVTFGYTPGEKVLEDVSLEVHRGEMIGLVGPSGAGKSTTINLLCRFYDPNEGTIEIDGIDVREVTQESLHRQIGVVLQEPYLFHGTIAHNIAYGVPGATMPAIMRAAKAANAHEFIMKFPDAYDTLVGERGQRLSGGERQRISIARAILKNPRILVLDEATSSVDTETEAAIQEALDRLVAGRTTFAIAHRFSTLRNADRLVVLDKGRVVEVGSHEELLAKENGLFKRLCEIQTKTSQIVAVGG